MPKCDFNKEHFWTAASEYANVCDLFHQYILTWNYETNFKCFIIQVYQNTQLPQGP